MIVATLVPLQAVALALVALGAPAVVLSRDPLKMIVVNGLYGLTLVLMFVIFGAPDVALSMLVVGTVAYPLVVLVAIARVRARSGEEEGEE
ncbi:MAG TPA: hydrogenase subunit MbhD domain-containing protein [Gaiellaceae bacterium]|nr:hydrogenase subunit MbhD domain-containing protein [Gaiellaceae bacterium]